MSGLFLGKVGFWRRYLPHRNLIRTPSVVLSAGKVPCLFSNLSQISQGPSPNLPGTFPKSPGDLSQISRGPSPNLPGTFPKSPWDLPQIPARPFPKNLNNSGRFSRNRYFCKKSLTKLGHPRLIIENVFCYETIGSDSKSPALHSGMGCWSRCGSRCSSRCSSRCGSRCSSRCSFRGGFSGSSRHSFRGSSRHSFRGSFRHSSRHSSRGCFR